MVPPESFSTEAPQSSSAFCSGCDGGTQCDSLSSKVLSCADAALTAPANAAAQTAAHRPAFRRNVMDSPPSVCVGFNPNFCGIQAHFEGVVKWIVGYQTICRGRWHTSGRPVLAGNDH